MFLIRHELIGMAAQTPRRLRPEAGRARTGLPRRGGAPTSPTGGAQPRSSVGVIELYQTKVNTRAGAMERPAVIARGDAAGHAIAAVNVNVAIVRRPTAAWYRDS